MGAGWAAGAIMTAGWFRGWVRSGVLWGWEEEGRLVAQLRGSGGSRPMEWLTCVGQDAGSKFGDHALGEDQGGEEPGLVSHQEEMKGCGGRGWPIPAGEEGWGRAGHMWTSVTVPLLFQSLTNLHPVGGHLEVCSFGIRARTEAWDWLCGLEQVA